MKTHTLAAIDIGSNAVRLLINNVIRYKGEVQFKKLNIVRLPIRLGADVFQTGAISERNRHRMVSAMKAYKEVLSVYEVDGFRGCATSAVRSAENGQQLLQTIKEKTDLHIEAISGEEEARIIYATHSDKLIERSGTYLYVDVGGGSTECTLFKDGNSLATKSFKIGTLRVLHNLVSDGLWNEFKYWLAGLSSNYGRFDLIGSGGNINKVFKSSLTKKGDPLSGKYISDYYNFICSMDYEERVAVLDHKPDRADVIEPAMKIFTTVFNQTGASKIYVPKIGLTDGIIRTLAADLGMVD